MTSDIKHQNVDLGPQALDPDRNDSSNFNKHDIAIC